MVAKQGAAKAAAKTGGGAGGKGERASILEVVASAVSALIILAIVAFLMWEGTRPAILPTFELRLGDPQRVGDVYYVPVRVRNGGTRAARGVAIRVEVAGGDPGPGAEVTLEWVPAKSERAGFAVLDEDPRGRALTARVTSFDPP
ncbi:MAG: hypothetical protein M3373_09920 [Gemmatimonadota bacterium]|nr:hypothetical protein [Gemmatimonadota bacterium]